MNDITLKTGFSKTMSNDEQIEINTVHVKENETNLTLNTKEDHLAILNKLVLSNTNICNKHDLLKSDSDSTKMAGNNKDKKIDVDILSSKKYDEVNVREAKKIPLVISEFLVSNNMNSNVKKETDTDYVKIDAENQQIEERKMSKEMIQVKDIHLNILDIPISSDVESKETRHEKNAKSTFGSQERQSKLVQVYAFTQSFAPAPIDGPALNYDPATRNSFVAIVLGIVLLMLICNIVLNFIILIVPDIRNLFIRVGFMIYIPALILLMFMNYAFVCCMCGRKTPCNVICLTLTVLAMTAMTGYITARKENHIIILAMIATAATVFVCFCLAMTRFDFTKLMIYFVAASLVFTILVMGVGIMWLVTGTHDKILHIVILFVGTLFQAFALIMELQMILGGRTIEIAEDDYSLGAFMIYTSIVSIFINLVQMFGLFDS